MTATNQSTSIASVTVKMDLANAPQHGDVWFRVRWIIKDNNGKSGEIFVLNSFSDST